MAAGVGTPLGRNSQLFNEMVYRRVALAFLTDGISLPFGKWTKYEIERLATQNDRLNQKSLTVWSLESPNSRLYHPPLLSTKSAVARVLPTSGIRTFFHSTGADPEGEKESRNTGWAEMASRLDAHVSRVLEKSRGNVLARRVGGCAGRKVDGETEHRAGYGERLLGASAVGEINWGVMERLRGLGELKVVFFFERILCRKFLHDLRNVWLFRFSGKF